MKKLYIIVLVVCALMTANAQNYQLFDAASQKVFTTYPQPGNTFSLHFESVDESGSNTVYNPYMGIADFEITTANCPLITSGYCFPETKPSWAGNMVNLNNATGIYSFETNEGFTVNLDMNTGETNTLLFEDAGQRFMLQAMDETFENVLGIYDSVKNLKVLHTDLQGNVINSALNNLILKAGKELGLITFFRIDSFPQILQPVTLMGLNNPAAGITQLTYADLYDYQPGDEVQYSERSLAVTCHTEVKYHRYTKLTYLEREDTPDSIIYTCYRKRFDADSTEVFYDTIITAWNRHTVVAQLPFDYNSHNDVLARKTLSYIDYCGQPMLTYTNTSLFLDYCEETGCWGSTDTLGVALEHSETSIAGVGRYRYTASEFLEGTTLVYKFEVNYFKKGMQTCGSEQFVVGTTGQNVPANRFVISPNPAGEYFSAFSTGNASGNMRVIILNSNGQQVKSINNYVSGEKIYTSGLQKGMYFVRLIQGNTVMTSKVVVY